MKAEGGAIGRAADIVIIVVAVAMLGMTAASHKRRPNPSKEPKVPANWRSEIATGIRMGPSNAEVTIVEFMDFQCPFCATWAARVDSLQEEFPNQIQVVFHHFPLSAIHRHAQEAAVASECAAQQNVFSQFQKVVFANQSQIGTKPWKEFAEESGVTDLPRYERCVSFPADSFPRIAYGLELAAKVKMVGTPTVWIDGTSGQLSLEELRNLVRGHVK